MVSLGPVVLVKDCKSSLFRFIIYMFRYGQWCALVVPIN